MSKPIQAASEKLRALCEGLEVQHIETVLAVGDIETFRKLGELIAVRTKAIRERHERACTATETGIE